MVQSRDRALLGYTNSLGLHVRLALKSTYPSPIRYVQGGFAMFTTKTTEEVR
jgi:hypothetical protein